MCGHKRKIPIPKPWSQNEDFSYKRTVSHAFADPHLAPSLYFYHRSGFCLSHDRFPGCLSISQRWLPLPPWRCFGSSLEHWDCVCCWDLLRYVKPLVAKTMKTMPTRIHGSERARARDTTIDYAPTFFNQVERPEPESYLSRLTEKQNQTTPSKGRRELHDHPEAGKKRPRKLNVERRI